MGCQRVASGCAKSFFLQFCFVGARYIAPFYSRHSCERVGLRREKSLFLFPRAGVGRTFLRGACLVARSQTDFSLGQGEAEAIALAQKERARIVGIDDKNGINAYKLLGIPFTTAVGILLRSREKGLLDRSAAFAGLAALAKYGRYKNSIIEDARLKLEVPE